MPYLYLILSIITEVIGVLFKTTDGFSKLYPTIATFISFSLVLFLSKTLQHLPLNITSLV